MQSEFVVRGGKYQRFIQNFMWSDHENTVKIYWGAINLLHVETGKDLTRGTWGHNII